MEDDRQHARPWRRAEPLWLDGFPNLVPHRRLRPAAGRLPDVLPATAAHPGIRRGEGGREGQRQAADARVQGRRETSAARLSQAEPARRRGGPRHVGGRGAEGSGEVDADGAATGAAAGQWRDARVERLVRCMCSKAPACPC